MRPATLLLGGALYALLRPWHCPVTQAAADRVKPGMTRAEVEKILGGPPGDYKTLPCEASGSFYSSPRPRGTCETWTGDEVAVKDWFEAGIVCRTNDAIEFPANPGIFDLIRFRLNDRLFP
jgi:hypothetical protein